MFDTSQNGMFWRMSQAERLSGNIGPYQVISNEVSPFTAIHLLCTTKTLEINGAYRTSIANNDP
jgi:hypothetical protein